MVELASRSARLSLLAPPIPGWPAPGFEYQKGLAFQAGGSGPGKGEIIRISGVLSGFVERLKGSSPGLMGNHTRIGDVTWTGWLQLSWTGAGWSSENCDNHPSRVTRLVYSTRVNICGRTSLEFMDSKQRNGVPRRIF